MPSWLLTAPTGEMGEFTSAALLALGGELVFLAGGLVALAASGLLAIPVAVGLPAPVPGNLTFFSRRNRPLSWRHVKYFSPLTMPLFFP